MKNFFVVLLMLVTVSLSAQNVLHAVLPNAPVSQLPETHKFFDRTNVVGFSVATGVVLADAAQTCYNMTAYNAHEDWLPFKHCASISFYTIGLGVAGNISMSYFFHKTGHHKLERLAPYIGMAPNVAGIIYSETHQARH